MVHFPEVVNKIWNPYLVCGFFFFVIEIFDKLNLVRPKPQRPFRNQKTHAKQKAWIGAGAEGGRRGYSRGVAG